MIRDWNVCDSYAGPGPILKASLIKRAEQELHLGAYPVRIWAVIDSTSQVKNRTDENAA